MLRIPTLLLLTLLCLCGRSQDTLAISDIHFSLPLDTRWAQADEPAGTEWTLDEARRQPYALQGRSASEGPALQPGQPAGPRWFRLPLRSAASDTLHAYLTLYRPGIVDLYLISDTGVMHKRGGMLRRISEREVKTGDGTAFAFRLAPGARASLYIRTAEPDGSRPRIEAYLQDRYTRRIVELNQINGLTPSGIFIGMLIIMMLYNLILFLSIRDRAYLYYCLYLLCLGAGLYFDSMVRAMPALGFDLPALNYLAGSLCFGASFIFYLLFGKYFIDLPALSPNWNRIMNWLIPIKWLVLAAGLIYSGFQADFSAAFSFIFLDNLLLVLLLPALFRIVWKSGSAIGRYFIFGSAMVFFVGFLTVVINNMVHYFNPFFVFSLAILAEILIFSLGLGYKMRKTQQEKLDAQLALNAELTKVNTAFGRFVPHEFLRSLGKASAVEAQLGDQVERVVTVLFSDIRDYTSLSEQMTPKDNFDFLNAYLGRIGPIIQAHGGFVNQYYGDGIMALFMEQPADALRAAAGMQQAIETYNAYRVSKGRTPLRIGIGLHTGSLMMGMIGDTLRMDTGVVSDTVNTASRMEGLTKYYGAGIILSESVYAGLPEALRQDIRRLGQVLVKGRKTPLQVYECFSGDPEPERSRKRASLDAFHAALDAYLSADFAAAMQQWEAFAGAPDGAAAHFAAQTLQYLRDGAPPGWAGIEAMAGK
ncbi:MAG: adenylate/guanylate cyclase domain-containing protein [Bacteroidia bacterium]|nr:adenylate/guanylate cyclase domain-containing protein [Bacteroidia bacterium]